MQPSTVYALIPARGGSKGLPGKNIRPLLGKPLIAWTIEAAKGCRSIDRVVVSTDSEEIADVARAHGAEVEMRPEALATDTATSADVVRHHLALWGSEGRTPAALALLQPTSPLRSSDDLEGAIARLFGEELDTIAGFTEAGSHPESAWRIVGGAAEPYFPGASPWRRRQDMAPAFALNGALYLVRADRFLQEGASFLFGKSGAYVMPADRSIDIDTIDDFMLAEFVAKRLGLG